MAASDGWWPSFVEDNVRSETQVMHGRTPARSHRIGAASAAAFHEFDQRIIMATEWLPTSWDLVGIFRCRWCGWNWKWWSDSIFRFDPTRFDLILSLSENIVFWCRLLTHSSSHQDDLGCKMLTHRELCFDIL